MHSDIKQRARELLAAEYVKEGRIVSAQETMSGNDLQAHAEYIAIRAITAALASQPQAPAAAVPEDVKDAINWLIGIAVLNDRPAAEECASVIRKWLAAAPAPEVSG